MVYIEVDAGSPIPVYSQIMDRIRALVRDGSLPPGSLLPSVRQLAGDLAVNPNTVAKAYTFLEREGIVETARRRGTLIAASAPTAAHRTVDGRLAETVDRIEQEAAGLGIGLDDIVRALEERRRRSGHRRPEGDSR